MIANSFEATAEVWVRYQEEDCGKPADVETYKYLWKHKRDEFIRAVRFCMKEGYSRLRLDPRDELKVAKRKIKNLEQYIAELQAQLEVRV